MELTDVAPFSTQLHPPASSLQPRSQGLAVKDGAAGVARPAKPRRADGSKRVPCGCNHSGDQGSPSGGSISARLHRPSNVGAGRITGVPRVARGGKASPIESGPGVGLSESRLDEGPASLQLVPLALIAPFAALGGPAGGRSTRGLRHRKGCGVARAHRSTTGGGGAAASSPAEGTKPRNNPGRRGSDTGRKQRSTGGPRRGSRPQAGASRGRSLTGAMTGAASAASTAA